MKIDFVISGGVSLGTYESGVMTAIMQAVDSQDIELNLISGASAGAITSFMCGLTLKHSLNPYILYNLWVNQADISFMFYKNTRSLLTLDCIKRSLSRIMNNIKQCEYSFNSQICIDNRSPQFCKYMKCKNKKAFNINSIIEMTPIEGYVTDIKKCFTEHELKAIVYNDFFIIAFDKWQHEKMDYYFDIVLSSSCVPFVFRTKHITKKREHFKHKMSDDYKQNKYTFNYTDGGMSDNLPFSSLFAANKKIENIAMIMPHPKDAKKLIKKTDKQGGFKKLNNPINELFKAYNASTYQSLYSDYKLLCSINQRIKICKDSEKQLINEINKLDENQKKEFDKLMKKIIGTNNWKDNLFNKIRYIANVKEKDYVGLYIISPQNPEQDLAGEILNHFGGFLDIRFRTNDFLLGYDDGIKFLKSKGIEIQRLFEAKETWGNIGIKGMRGKKYLIVLILKIIPVILHSYKNRFPINIIYFITRLLFESMCNILNIKQYN